MATPSTPRGIARRLLARDAVDALHADVRQLSQRLDDVDARLRSAVTRIDGLDASIGTLARTLDAADPVMTRQVVDALRADVAELVAAVNGRLGERADAQPT